LGAGKTTLLKNILERENFQRYVVIVNEFAQIGIDKQLIVHEEETLFELSNGCLCCEIRSDLVSLLNEISEHTEDYAGVIIETSGMASPMPIIQTFSVDEAVPEGFELERVVTVVDAGYLDINLAEYPEAADQIACADRVILNKTSALSDAEKTQAVSRITSLNPQAGCIITDYSRVDVDELFSVRRESNPFPVFKPGSIQPAQNGLVIRAAHESNVSSFCLQTENKINTDIFLDWIQKLVMYHGNDLIRMKGILFFYDENSPFVFHGVRNSLDGELDEEQQLTTNNISQLVVIGRNLDRDQLTSGFEACFY
ncbi:MAG: hypothetical protein CMI13_16530, partial [Oleibacter sp.]|nr:hypothetical protein [Thalassolituus sp.]